MNALASLMKLALYRIIFNLPLGIIGIEIFHNIFFKKGILVKINGQGIQLYTFLVNHINFFIAFLYGVVAILAGEVFALLGESILNFLYDYNPVANNYIEKVSCKTQNKICFECFNYFIRNAGEALNEISEIHFVMSRIMAGLGFLTVISSIGFNLTGAEFCFIILIIIIYVICLKCDKNFCLLITILLSILIMPSAIFVFLKFKKFCINILLFCLGIFLICCAMYYRSHANRIIFNYLRKSS